MQEKRKRKNKSKIKNGLICLSVALAIVIFVLSATQLTFTNPWGMLAMVLTGGYILTFCWVNEVE